MIDLNQYLTGASPYDGAVALKYDEGDYSLVNDLLKIAQNPFDEHSEFERYAQPTPMKFANIKLSCSS